jgi:hypothetical protein
MIEFLDNEKLWKPKEFFEKNKICSLCYSTHLLNISHISNAIHKNNISKLFDGWEKVDEDKVFRYIHEKKITNKGLKKKKK